MESAERKQQRLMAACAAQLKEACEELREDEYGLGKDDHLAGMPTWDDIQVKGGGGLFPPPEKTSTGSRSTGLSGAGDGGRMQLALRQCRPARAGGANLPSLCARRSWS